MIPILGDLINGALDKIGGLASELIVDKDKRNELQVELERTKLELTDKAEQRLHEELTGQMEINKIEAGHRSIFVAGWRPAIGWVSAAGLAWTFVCGPFVEFGARLFGFKGAMPIIDVAQLMTLVMAMLGMGVMRSYDKKQGTANDYLKTQPVDLVPQAVKDSPPDDVPWSSD